MELSTILLSLVLLGVVQCSSITLDTNSILQTDYNIMTSCRDGRKLVSTIRTIQPQPGFGSRFDVLCDNSYEGGGWIVIQQRFSGVVNFYRGWREYEDGFGNMMGEFWLGLKKIYELTYSNKFELHVLMEDWDGKIAVAKYSHFMVAGPEEKYKLSSLGQYNGTAGDSLEFSLNMPFSTLDQENDPDLVQNCARDYSGAWWYKSCHQSNLNGLYVKGQVTDYANMMCWRTWRGHYYGLKVARMLIREVQ